MIVKIPQFNFEGLKQFNPFNNKKEQTKPMTDNTNQQQKQDTTNQDEQPRSSKKKKGSLPNLSLETRQQFNLGFQNQKSKQKSNSDKPRSVKVRDQKTRTK